MTWNHIKLNEIVIQSNTPVASCYAGTSITFVLLSCLKCVLVVAENSEDDGIIRSELAVTACLNNFPPVSCPKSQPFFFFFLVKH